MANKVVTNDGKKGGWLVGKRHYDKNGKSLGGIKAVVTDAGGKPVELEGGEVIINREASKKYWKELSKINQSAGNGVAIEPPTDAFDEDPAEDYENGGKIEFNANHIPNKWILNYAIKIKEEHPDVWALGGNIFGNQAFINLKRVAERGHWLDSEEWMYKKWRSFVARHQGDFRIQGVIAMLKWVDKVDKGWQYMKNLIEEEIKKREARKSKKMSNGGSVNSKVKYSVKFKKRKSLGNYDRELEISESNKTLNQIYNLLYNVEYKDNGWYIRGAIYIEDTNGLQIRISEFKSNLDLEKMFAEKRSESNMMNDGGNVGRTPAPLSERIKGSKFNASGSAKDSTSGKDIKFDDKTIASIQSLIDAHNEKYPSKKITLGVAKAVVRRGMGAYSSSHRPTITGGKPNSRTAWGLARLKAFIHKAEKGKSKSGKYSQDNDLFDDLDIKVSKYADGGDVRSMNWYTDFKKQQLKKGTEHELEHADTIEKFKKKGVSDREVAAQIAKDHLEEDENYYIELDKMEGKKFATGGIVENGISINIGDTGLYGRSKDQITITGITTKLVNFTTSDGKKKGIYIDSFAKNYIPDNPSNYVQSGSNKSTSPQTSSEWRVKTVDELISVGLFRNGEYRGIDASIINKWNENNIEEIDKNVISNLKSGKTYFSFDGFNVGIGLFTKDPLPIIQSKSQTSGEWRVKTYDELKAQDLLDVRGEYFGISDFTIGKWAGRNIKEIDKDALKYLDSGYNLRFAFNGYSVKRDLFTQDPLPTIQSKNVATNLGQTQPQDLRPSTDSDVWDATFKVGDIVYIRKDIADFVGIDFDSDDNVFKIITEKFEGTVKSPKNKTGSLYKIEQIKNIANKRIFQLEGKDIALVDSNQTKQDIYELKKSIFATDLFNTKIIVDTPEKSEAFQNIAFELGIGWGVDNYKSVQNLDKPYLYITQDIVSQKQSLGYTSNTDIGRDYYENSTLKEIKFDDLFELKGQNKRILSDESLEELFKDVKSIDKEREAIEATPQKNETQINDELKALEDEYSDLLFLIDITPSTDVDNMLALKLQAKQLKDKIDLLHLDLKKKIDGELQLLDNLFNASSVKPQERYKFNAYNDGFAPDGQPTSLPKNLYDWTMTEEFQNWFGNFTNAYNYRNSSYENVPCSVVVNKHYEPLVVYHGTGVEFSFFKFDKFPAMYFAENEAYSNWFAEKKGQQSGTRGYVYPFFLNIRTPLDLTIYGIEPVSPDDFIDWMFLQTGLDADELKISKALLDPTQKFQAWMYLRNSPEMLNVLRDKAVCDGIIYYEDNPSVDKTSDAYQTKAYIVFNSNSAKIADPNREMMTIPAMRSFYLKRGGKL